MTDTPPISWGRRIAQLAEERGDDVAIWFLARDGSEHALGWRDYHLAANRVARLLADRGVTDRSTVVVALPNSLDHFVVSLAAWRLGACVLPLSPRTPAAERAEVLRLVATERPAVVVEQPVLADAATYSAEPLPDVVAHPGKAILSGGSTGRPKVIVDVSPWAAVPGELFGGSDGLAWLLGMRPDQVQLVAGPLYHNAPFCWSHLGLFAGHTLVVLERFDAAATLDAVERHRVQFAFVVPTMMQRMLRVVDVAERDLSSMQSLWHTGGPCPAWVKRRWIELLAPDRVHEAYGATEGIGALVVSGTEWLEHPGTVGRPRLSDVRIVGEDGRECPDGVVGEIQMRPKGASGSPAFAYLGADPLPSDEGFMSVGDLGSRDADAYVYLADRRVDLILSGGANVYPAEVEAALSELPDVADVAVVGVPHDDLGQSVHAIVEAADVEAPPSEAELDAHVRGRIAAYKVPRSYEVVERLPRDESGKIRRTALAAARRPTERQERNR